MITKEDLLKVKEAVLKRLDNDTFEMSNWEQLKSCGTVCCIGGTMAKMGLFKNISSNGSPEDYKMMPDIEETQQAWESNLFHSQCWYSFASQELNDLLDDVYCNDEFDELYLIEKEKIIELVFDDYINKYYRD
jgi:hypothetical protein